jgi:hypothetical protein
MCTALRMALAQMDGRPDVPALADLDDEQTMQVAVAAVTALVGTLLDVLGPEEAPVYLRRLLLEVTWMSS